MSEVRCRGKPPPGTSTTMRRTYPISSERIRIRTQARRSKESSGRWGCWRLPRCVLYPFQLVYCEMHWGCQPPGNVVFLPDDRSPMHRGQRLPVWGVSLSLLGGKGCWSCFLYKIPDDSALSSRFFLLDNDSKLVEKRSTSQILGCHFHRIIDGAESWVFRFLNQLLKGLAFFHSWWIVLPAVQISDQGSSSFTCPLGTFNDWEDTVGWYPLGKAQRSSSSYPGGKGASIRIIGGLSPCPEDFRTDRRIGLCGFGR